MSELEAEVQISDLLTCYIQQFKNILSAKLSLIESICTSNHSLQNNPQFLLSKLASKSFKIDWAVDPLTIFVNEKSTSIIQRFYLRLQEYLEYRFEALASINETGFNKEIDNFQRQLQKIIRGYHTNNEKESSLGNLFQQLNLSESRFVAGLLAVLEKKKSMNVRGRIDYQCLEEVKKFIETKICGEESSGVRLASKLQLSNREMLSLPSKKTTRGQFKNWGHKLTAKIQLPFYPVIINPQSPMYDRPNWKQGENVPEDSSEELQRYLKQQGKSKLNRAYSILDLEEATLVSRDALIHELQLRNGKNKSLMDKYVRKYERKVKRLERRDQSERTTKSTAKGMKSASKSKNMNIFQHAEGDNRKSRVETTQKIEGVELPAIGSRHNRRITVQN